MKLYKVERACDQYTLSKLSGKGKYWKFMTIRFGSSENIPYALSKEVKRVELENDEAAILWFKLNY